MYRVMLVDDEMLSLRNMERMLKEMRSDLCIVYKACNGEDALSHIPEFMPDIVITDMKMPIINGVELVKRLNSDYSRIYSIVVSAYMEFEYSREALRNNVVDYLLKPVEPDQLKEVFEKICAKLEARRKSESAEYLQRLISRNPAESKPDAFLSGNNFYISTIRYGALPDRLNPKTYPGSNELFPAIELLVKQLLEPAGTLYWFLNGHDENEKHLVIGFSTIPAIKIEEIAGRILESFKSAGGFITIAFHPYCLSVDRLPAAFYKSVACISQHLVIAKSQLLSTEQTMKQYPKNLLELDGALMKRLSFYSESGNFKSITVEMEKLFQDCQNSELPQHMAEDLVWQLVKFFKRFFNKSAPMDCDIQGIISETLVLAADLKSFCGSFCELLKELLDSNPGTVRKIDSDLLFMDVDRYLHQNLSSYISLQSICSHFKFSQSFLSRLFRAHTGLSFNEYMTKLRIQEAQAIMKKYPDMKLKEIAELTGFSDHHYFSKVFKSVTAITPSDFRGL